MQLDADFMARDDPFTLVLDALIEKLNKREQPFGGLFLHDWCEAVQKPLTIRAWTGDDPLDEMPMPSECPLIRIAGDEGPPWEPKGIGASQIKIVYRVLGYIYDADHRVANRFRYLSMSAIGHPWLNSLCPVTASTTLLKKWGPLEGAGQGPIPMPSPRRGSNLWVWVLPLEFTFMGADLPFFNPGM